MIDETRRPGGQPDGDAGSELGDEGEVQIIEVEGLDMDAPPPPAADSEEEGEHPGAEAGVSGGGEGERFQALREQVDSLQEDLLRARADFENYRKRQERDRAAYAKHAAADLVSQVLPVIDNFLRALTVEDDGASEGYKQGIQMIYDQLTDVLAKAGLTPIETEGKPFDPELHEAVAREETSEVEANTITEELEPGYLFRDRLLKPARVRVAVPPRS